MKATTWLATKVGIKSLQPKTLLILTAVLIIGLPVKLFSEEVQTEDNLALIPITNKSILEFYPPIRDSGRNLRLAA